MKYVCQICGYIYDDDKEKQSFHELSDDFKCPLCGALKSDFKEETDNSHVKAQVTKDIDTDFKKLSVGQLAALCSNLARGCEKQYKTTESQLFTQLADYFTSITPSIDDASVDALANTLQNDCDEYSTLRMIADDNQDRGAARVCVWGEKVTRMLSSLVKRYQNEGEKMLSDTNIWVCTTCGFVYVGDEAPKLCPVCKVPDWKFEKIEGRV